MTHVQPVCTSISNCMIMEAFYSPNGLENLIENLFIGFGFAIVVVGLMIAGMYLNRAIKSKRRKNSGY